MSDVICMWSGPRNLSTAMMRSFSARADCAVYDEPFYAAYLAATGKIHPGRDIILTAHETDPVRIAQSCVQTPPCQSRFFFQKQMPHHMLDTFPMGWAQEARHFFLIREPLRVIRSYARERADFTLEDLGFSAQRRLYDQLFDMTGVRPPVIDSVDILRNPERALSALCQSIHIPFDPAMLSWEAGPRPEDGAWAPFWYASVERSTHFGSPPTDEPQIDAQYQPLLAACEADYEALKRSKLDFS